MGRKCRHDSRKKDIGTNEKQNSVFDNKHSKYNLLCLHIAAYPTPKEKTVVITFAYTINQTHFSPILTSQESNVRRVYIVAHDILHDSSSFPQQHKSVQYKWLALHLHRDVLHTDMLQPHFISCRGVLGAGGNMRLSRNFCQFF